MKTPVLKAYQQGSTLSTGNKEYRNWLKRYFLNELKDDLAKKGDITSNALLGEEKATAVIVAKENGILAGVEEVIFLAGLFKVDAKPGRKDGQPITKGTNILTLSGKARTLLKIERIVLNMLQRMSGIATATGGIIRKTRNKVAVAPTRKTVLKYLDKKAVYAGGGATHRIGLHDAILIKDNHLAILKKKYGNYMEKAVKEAEKKQKHAGFIGIEVKSLKEALEAAHAGRKIKKVPFILLLDNMKPNKIREIVAALRKEGLRSNVLLEASGGINEKNAGAYAQTGVDVISMGSLTHSVKALDMSMEIQ
ncbi:carboxylating nicotinate-nucleotide diphosphorylase [Candidatus Woesearchaeota archaeon]|nr:carboxylating nicotinate-nucleotide diphosphorylase [Candidatus Woesearchaeota archaeon]